MAETASDCLFCKIGSGEVGADVVHRSDDIVAFRDINPQAPTHILVIPREHVASLNHATDAAMIGRLSLVAAEFLEIFRAAT